MWRVKRDFSLWTRLKEHDKIAFGASAITKKFNQKAEMAKFDQELMDLGLSEKEAAVYLSSIQLGPSPVQKISRKAKVNRATTYVIIDSLTEMGLMSKYEEGKKTFFVAERPKRLIGYFKEKERNLREKLEKINQIVPELDSLYNDFSDKPKVKYYEGVEGLKAVYNDFSEGQKEGDLIYTFLPLDEFEKSVLNKKLSNARRKRVNKRVSMKVIYTSKKGRSLDYENEGKGNLIETSFVEYENYPFEGGMNVYRDKIFMIDYKGKLGGIVIENATLASMMRQVFLISWNSTNKKIN